MIDLHLQLPIIVKLKANNLLLTVLRDYEWSHLFFILWHNLRPYIIITIIHRHSENFHPERWPFRCYSKTQSKRDSARAKHRASGGKLLVRVIAVLGIYVMALKAIRSEFCTISLGNNEFCTISLGNMHSHLYKIKTFARCFISDLPGGPWRWLCLSA